MRRIVAEGHTPALLLNASPDRARRPGCQPDRCKRASDAAHRRIHAHRFHDTGCVKLTQAQRDALIGAGYRLWTPPFDSGDAAQSAARAYATTAQNFVSTTATVVVRLHHSASTAQTVRSLSAYMSRQGIPSSRVILSATPINSTSDTR